MTILVFNEELFWTSKVLKMTETVEALSIILVQIEKFWKTWKLQQYSA